MKAGIRQGAGWFLVALALVAWVVLVWAANLEAGQVRRAPETPRAAYARGVCDALEAVEYVEFMAKGRGRTNTWSQTCMQVKSRLGVGGLR